VNGARSSSVSSGLHWLFSVLMVTSGNILYNRGIAFVTYESEHQASFAKEAMANQSMDMEEILNVR
jgi:hypothetical protein